MTHGQNSSSASKLLYNSQTKCLNVSEAYAVFPFPI